MASSNGDALTKPFAKVLQNILPGDVLNLFNETQFSFSGPRNKRFRYWTVENSTLLHQRTLHSPRGTVCGVVAEFSVWRAYFFEEDKLNYGERTDTISSMCHQ
ncbi:hypothetical protein TNCV_1030871 [Trichonephila clavipes]|nr:hypothetical protein TNCV_1030871 [Trichonephila clavipes]